jgi:hypothetical protein
MILKKRFPSHNRNFQIFVRAPKRRNLQLCQSPISQGAFMNLRALINEIVSIVWSSQSVHLALAMRSLWQSKSP